MGKCLFAMLLLACWGCADESETVEVQAELTIGTFNAGLARGYVDHAALRVDVQLDRLGSMRKMDVLCLQEIWDPSDRGRFIEVLSERFPFSHFENTTNDALFADVEPQPAHVIALRQTPWRNALNRCVRAILILPPVYSPTVANCFRR